jgi:putative nucleotidyltransferase with HDIG domain
MQKFLRLRPIARWYVGLVVIAGAVTLVHSIHSVYVSPIGPQWLILAILTLLTGSFTVKIPSVQAHLSVSEAFVFASVLMFGASAGAITVLLECLVILFWMTPKGQPTHRVLFNMAAPAVSIWLSAQIFFVIGGIPPLAQRSTSLPELFIPLLVFTSLYFLLNSWLVAIAVGVETRRPASRIWRDNFPWLSVNYFSGASVAALIATYTTQLEASTLVVIVPLLVVSYLTFRTAMGRMDDTNKHLRELNRLHLSTIETLAMAIDAKDQITHGHIRRVQTYAVGLAKKVGVSDPILIRAIEAAALLHDTGKLAVPEYILNKPGRLTGAEFEKMKVHASVGADILSSIEFPYPVVPIVRHHHENWDGTGYPAGLKGTDIPMGARILSVVDCFDALTSDRPYRPRLSDADAVDILLERRGFMYDPLIVDTFIRVYEELAPQLQTNTGADAALNEITSAAIQKGDLNRGLDIGSSVPPTTLSMHQLNDVRSLEVRIDNSASALATTIREAIPCALVVFFAYDDSTDEIVATHAAGEGFLGVQGLRMQLGERLSGWVAANRQSIVNSDAVLDLGDHARSVVPPLRTCLSTPILVNDRLAGVLTLYAVEAGRFTEDDSRLLARAAEQVGLAMRATLTQEEPRRRFGGLRLSLAESAN